MLAWTRYLQTAAPEQVQVVTSQEELDYIREQRFREGVWEASRGALEWGAGAAAFIYASRALEPKMLGSHVLQKAGTARLWWFITAASAYGFALRGENNFSQRVWLDCSKLRSQPLPSG